MERKLQTRLSPIKVPTTEPQLVQVRSERSSTGSGVFRRRLLVCDPAAVSELDIDVTYGVDAG